MIRKLEQRSNKLAGRGRLDWLAALKADSWVELAISIKDKKDRQHS